MIYRGGPGSPVLRRSGAHRERSGAIKLVTGLMDVGEGATTVLPQIAAEVLGAEYDQVEAVFADTQGTPDAPITAGSTATFSTGTAVVQAANGGARVAAGNRLVWAGGAGARPRHRTRLGVRQVRPVATHSAGRGRGANGRRCAVGNSIGDSRQHETHRQLFWRPLRRGGGGHRYWSGACPAVRGGPRLRAHHQPPYRAEPGRGRHQPDAGLCPVGGAGTPTPPPASP